MSLTIINWLKAVRIHQWTKNLLLFVPLGTSFTYDYHSIKSAVAAFFAFSFLASATYIANDWRDLESDRGHPTKRNRPIASGAVSIPVSAGIATFLILACAGLAWQLPAPFQIMLVGYLFLTLTYSFFVKNYFMLDVILIALLYTWRIMAGAMAIGVETSAWLLAFSAFFFLGLALIKRCADLLTVVSDGKRKLSGRDYRVTDYDVMQSLGAAASMAAVVILCLFINSPETQEQYAAPQGLWLVACAILYWSTRLWVKTARGEMHDDPVVYALKDRNSQVIMLFIATMVWASHSIQPFGQ